MIIKMLVLLIFRNGIRIIDSQNRQSTYNVTLWGLRANIVAVEKQ